MRQQLSIAVQSLHRNGKAPLCRPKGVIPNGASLKLHAYRSLNLAKGFGRKSTVLLASSLMFLAVTRVDAAG